jgi:hypothetical protein
MTNAITPKNRCKKRISGQLGQNSIQRPSTIRPLAAIGMAPTIIPAPAGPRQPPKARATAAIPSRINATNSTKPQKPRGPPVDVVVGVVVVGVVVVGVVVVGVGVVGVGVVVVGVGVVVVGVGVVVVGVVVVGVIEPHCTVTCVVALSLHVGSLSVRVTVTVYVPVVSGGYVYVTLDPST